MPLYLFQCPVENCDTQYDDLYFSLQDFADPIFDWCPKHGHQDFVLVLGGHAVHDWGEDGQGRYYEHVSATGEHFTSKKQFKEYCKKHQLEEHCSYG